MSDHSITYYFNSIVGGALACGLIHISRLPFNILKCRFPFEPKHGCDILNVLTTEDMKGITLVVLLVIPSPLID